MSISDYQENVSDNQENAEKSASHSGDPSANGSTPGAGGKRKRSSGDKAGKPVYLAAGHRVRFDMPPPDDWTAVVESDSKAGDNGVVVRRDNHGTLTCPFKKDLTELDGSPLKGDRMPRRSQPPPQRNC